ncbi:family 43 glycosylhydrolase [Bacillus sp. SA1-12]|uniref:family 43 glycosylhydrolase n=1 Tax=Bacillus sp. SA1-12 TaxID=1455638 RepID=UPI0006977D65|nr:family 43 glycosylhydrolase [Bacillus sp. SA1-12]
MFFKNINRIALVAIMLWSSLFSQQVIFAEEESTTEPDASLLAHYPLIEDVNDVSGNGKHGVAVGDITFTDGLTLPGGMNSNTNYVKLPDGLFDQQDSVTISTWLKSNTGSGNYSALFFGTPANANKVPENYWLFNPTNPSGNFKSVFTNSANSSAPWSTEIGVTSTNTTGKHGKWTHYTTVITPTSVIGYINGEKIGTVNKTRKTSNFGTGLNAYIGRSNYLNDHTFAGSFQDLRIYSEALDDTDIHHVYEESVSKFSLQQDQKKLTLGDISSVAGNIILPATGSNGSTISWKSSNEKILSNTGIVTFSDEEQTATLTATLELNGYKATKDFTITVVSLKKVTETIANKLYIPYVLTKDDKLPAASGVASISWESSDPSVVGNNGTIHSSAEGMKEVSLTATISYKEQQTTKEYHVKVMEASASYILSYHRAGGSVITDAMHMGYSKDGENYMALNNNTGVLFANADFNAGDKKEGVTKKLVNPYIFRMKDGTFGVIATRLNKDGSQSQAEKSSILLFKSEDLISYKEIGLRSLNTNETVVKPIAEYDPSSDEYRIEWKTSNGKSYYNTTQDFKTVSQPKEGAKIIVDEVFANIANSIPGNRIVVTKAEAEVMTKKLAKVTNTNVSNIEINVENNQEFTFDDLKNRKVTASYSDGSTADKAVNWNEDEFNQIDFSEAGTYTVSGTVKQTTYPKEMIRGYADPGVIKYNGKYYLIATNESGFTSLDVREADTILGLKDSPVNTIFNHNTSGELSGSLWAPEFHNINGDLYVFCAGGSPHWYTVQSYVMKLKDGGNPATPTDWETPKRVLKKDGGFLADSGLTYDMTYFEHKNEHYVIYNYGGPAGTPDEISTLLIAKINPDEPWKLTTDPIVINKPNYGWERLTTEVVEGSFILKHGDQIHLTYSASGVDTTYCLGLLSANENSDLLDPASWTKNNYPILNSESVSGEYGPGHNSYALDEDGNLVNVYHTMPAGGGHRNISARIVHWAADGTPVLDMIPEREILPENRTVTAVIIVGESESKDTESPVGHFTINSGAEYTNERAVTLFLEATDDSSGVKQVRYSTDAKEWTDWEPYTTTKEWTLPSGDGEKNVFLEFIDQAGNVSETYQQKIILDTTAPVIQLIGHQDSYSIDSTINIRCYIVDKLSGIASEKCPKVEGSAYSFEVGVHTFTASATDKAGNTANVEFQFTVTVDFDSLSRLTEAFVTKQGVADSLTKKLQAAKASAVKENTEALNGQLNAYKNQLNAQSGKTISERNSKLLGSLADSLKNNH